MKRLLFIMLFTSFVHSQKGVSFSALHDVKLGLGLDKEFNDGKPTMDLIINLNLEGKQYEYYYFALQMLYERAELKSGYFSRYGVNAMWNLNSLLLPKLKMGFGFGLHIIERQNTGGLGTYSGTLDVSYPIFGGLHVVAKNEYLRRPDLEVPKTVYNLSIGLNYKF